MKLLTWIFRIILINVVFCINGFSQDTVKSLTLSYNFLKTFSNEYSLDVEYKFHKRLSIALTVGKVHDNPDHYVYKLSSSQKDFPGLVYKGFVTRASIDYYLVSTNSYGFYVGPRFLYKYLYYNKMSFIDSWGDQGSNTYIRNEIANMYGFDLVFGWNFYMGNTDNPVDFYLNLNGGFGIRYRHRNVETISSETSGDPDYTVPLGIEIKDQKYGYCSLIGIKIGMRIKLDPKYWNQNK